MSITVYAAVTLVDDIVTNGRNLTGTERAFIKQFEENSDLLKRTSARQRQWIKDIHKRRVG